MIAVLAQESEHDAVREFFELFKTPWCFFEDGCDHDVLMVTTGKLPRTTASLILIYGGKSTGGGSAEAVSDNQTIVRFELPIFAEVARLLTAGQSVEEASKPTLDSIIQSLRQAMLEHGITFVEIPPVPAGHPFIACLTHDVDHAGVLYQKFDHTIAGFLYRAFFRSVVDLLAGRKRFAQLVANWKAAVSLPFVYAGLASDFWKQFERYLALEGSARSTFFVLSRANYAGLTETGAAPAKRAVYYELDDLADDLEQLRAHDREIALHGIDAWRDSAAGQAERKLLEEHVPAADEVGVRMHWLYFDRESPQRLEAAGFSYDSTVGYNDTVGYRAGTTQCYRPCGVGRLLELPLHIMDTALFYPPYLNLSAKEAAIVTAPLLAHAESFGGVVTINWHDRSLGPERLWEEPYVQLIAALRAKNAWFAKASDAVRWFRSRRSASFAVVSGRDAGLNVRVTSPAHTNQNLPGLLLRVHRPARDGNPASYTDSLLGGTSEMLVAA